MCFNAITVYCGSSPGKDKEFLEAARALGKCFLKNNIKLIYGGGTNGLMGEVSKTVAEGGGDVTGVTPQFFHTNGLKKGPGKQIIIETMHERKQYMFDNADGFIALPGGYGTMEELLEMITWVQLGLHHKPIGILNVNNFYKGFLDWVAHADNQEFLYKATSIFVTSDDPEDLVRKMRECRAKNLKNYTTA